ncbi:E3 ubiquitin-protein ligase RNF13-like [Paramacrobiotus metropolitanus]|uniref:E3 ubiquitin-protein ligase RNF13-like n=1 Tax=Paramacrobiotus metropolitanus TaxID=2943436 RepID=UPI0024459C3C|nr:E3 ubiquitin-protein ligase RNF13-like [Paramacrobiotus metropolitanus]
MLTLAASSIIASFYLLSSVEADVLVIGGPKNDTMYRFADMPASDHFGPSIPSDGLEGYLVLSDPINGCTPIRPPPPGSNMSVLRPWIILIKRGGCDFDTKVLNAQNAGYISAIVYNNGSQNLIPMSGTHGDEIQIPSVFVSYRDGIMLATDFTWTSGYHIVITPDYPVISLNAILLPFAIVVGICFFVLTMVLVAKYVRDRRRRQRHRLPKSQLKKIAIKKFKKGEGNDVCAICLDEFEEGDKMRVLPCHHQYHCKCVDPWLLNNKRVCPVCKRKVIPGDDSDDEATTGGGRSSAEPSEVTPLLSPAHNAPLENDLPVQHPAHLVNVEFISDDEDDGSSESRTVRTTHPVTITSSPSYNTDEMPSTSGTSYFSTVTEVSPPSAPTGNETDDDNDVPLIRLTDSNDSLIRRV